jgi:hypothetical protein
VIGEVVEIVGRVDPPLPHQEVVEAERGLVAVEVEVQPTAVDEGVRIGGVDVGDDRIAVSGEDRIGRHLGRCGGHGAAEAG